MKRVYSVLQPKQYALGQLIYKTGPDVATWIGGGVSRESGGGIDQPPFLETPAHDPIAVPAIRIVHHCPLPIHRRLAVGFPRLLGEGFRLLSPRPLGEGRGEGCLAVQTDRLPAGRFR